MKITQAGNYSELQPRDIFTSLSGPTSVAATVMMWKEGAITLEMELSSSHGWAV